MLYALRGARGPSKFCSAERHENRKFNTVKDDITTKLTEHYTVFDNDQIFQLEKSICPGEEDSKIVVGERARGTKLDSLYKKNDKIVKKRRTRSQ